MMPRQPDAPAPPAPRRLRILSFNIQAGTRTDHPTQYVTRGWQSVLPHASKTTNLRAISQLLAEYDIVGLQVSDGGSLRSGFGNQTHQLAEMAGFDYWAEQTNRSLARLAKPGNGFLSQLTPVALIDHRLPGAIPGRGAMEMQIGPSRTGLHVINAHLALTARARRRQFEYLAELIDDSPHVVLLGDFNTSVASGELDVLFERTRLRPPMIETPTFPAWRPRRAIDHVLLTESLTALSLEVPLLRASDHLPVALNLALPASCKLTMPGQ